MWRFIIDRNGLIRWQHRHAANCFGVSGPLIGQAHRGFVSLYECEQNARLFGYAGPALQREMIA